MVPVTVIRDVYGHTGSVQEFLGEVQSGYGIPLENLSQDDLYKLWILDYIIWNSDRHSGNILVRGDKVIAIDHGLTFGNELPLRTRGSYFDIPTPLQVTNLLGEALSDESRLRQLQQNLGELLNEEENQACLARIKYIYGIISRDRKVPSGTSLDFHPN